MNTTLPYNHHHAIHEKLDGYWTPESISALLALSPEDKQSIAVQSYTELVSQDVTLHGYLEWKSLLDHHLHALDDEQVATLHGVARQVTNNLRHACKKALYLLEKNSKNIENAHTTLAALDIEIREYVTYLEKYEARANEHMTSHEIMTQTTRDHVAQLLA